MALDWDTVWRIGTIVGAGLGGGFINNVVLKRADRAEKAEERRVARDELFRADLRQAYAHFIGSYGKLLHISRHMISIRRRLHKQRSEEERDALEQGADDAKHIYDGAGDPRIVAKSRQLSDDFNGARLDAQMRLSEVLLLESHPSLQSMLISIFDADVEPPPPRDPKEYDEFEAAIDERQQKLDDLLRELKGGFSPQNWEARTSGPRAARLQRFLKRDKPSTG